MISFDCPKCRAELEINERKAGKSVSCPECESLIVVPHFSEKPHSEQNEAARREAYIGKGGMWGRISDSHIRKAEDTLLLSGERIEAIVRGRVKESTTKADGFLRVLDTKTDKGGSFVNNYLIVTNHRVLLWARGMVKSSTDAFDFEDIKSVEYQSGMVFAGIVLNVHGKNENFTEMDKKEASLIVDLIRKKISRTKEGTRRDSAPLPNIDPAAQIEKLAILRDKGLISQREFEEKRRKLLDLI